MLVLWDEEIELRNPETQEWESQKYRQGAVVPDCCAAVRNSMVIRLQAGDSENSGKPLWFLDVSMSVYALQRHANKKSQYFRIQFCPYCGKSLPEVQKAKNNPFPVYVPSGYSCLTCGKEYDVCLCLPPECAYEVPE